MKSFSAVVALATAALTSATPIVTRDQTLVNDLIALDEAIVAATYVVGNYTGGAAGYAAIAEALQVGIAANRNAYNYALTLSEQTLNESNAIIAEVAGPIETDINTAVAVLISKADLIDEAGFKNETATTLEVISSDHDTLSLAVGAILDPATLAEAIGPVLEIDYQWRRSVVAFGGIPLAPLIFPEP